MYTKKGKNDAEMRTPQDGTGMAQTSTMTAGRAPEHEWGTTMKAFLTALVATLALGSMAVIAQTPDGETPAVEAVCDSLKADGVTKGLYGLCVAYCEAQDHADDSSPISPEDAEALYDVRPGGKILTNYERKRDKAANPLDPPMPCIVIEEPCPCWSAEELAATGDGLVPGGQPATYVSCHDSINPYYDQTIVRDYYEVWDTWDGSDSNYEFASDYAQTLDYHTNWGWGNEDTDNVCYYENYHYNQDGNLRDRFFRFGSVEQGTLTQEQFETCQSNLREHRAALIANGSTCQQ